MKNNRSTAERYFIKAISRVSCVVLVLCLVIVIYSGFIPKHPVDPGSKSITANKPVSVIDTFITSDAPLTNNTGVFRTVSKLDTLFYDELSLVPIDHIIFLCKRGWQIKLTSEDLAKKYGYSDPICGITVYEDKIIYISSTEYAIKRSTIHEVGHALAYELGWAEVTIEFINLYEWEGFNFTDCRSIGDGHELDNIQEYFASVYQNMILDYEETKGEVPGTVEYIERRLSEIHIFTFDKIRTRSSDFNHPGTF